MRKFLTPKQEKILFAINTRRMYGLQIQAAIEQSSKGREKVSYGSLYPLLHLLEQEGLLKYEWGDEMENTSGARRKYYTLTSLGRKVLSERKEYYFALLEGKYV